MARKLSARVREQMTEACIDDHLNTIASGEARGWVGDILMSGFQGYANMTDQEIVDAFTTAGLDERKPSLGGGCDECGSFIPTHNGGGLASSWHADSCSLYDDKEP